MELARAKQLARQLMDEHGLNDIPLRITNGKRYLGSCTFRVSRSAITRMFGETRYQLECIKLSRYVVTLNDENEIRDVILHEIAHALVGAEHGHDAVWRRKAIEIGCSGRRTSKTANMPKGRYKAECSCGKVYYKHRKGRNVLRTNYWRCGICKNVIQFRDMQFA